MTPTTTPTTTPRSELQNGDRVRLMVAIDRFPDFIAQPGFGTIVDFEEENGIFSVCMDDRIPGCELWDNGIQFTDNDNEDWENPPLVKTGAGEPGFGLWQV
jgi:hypothetical protein